MRRIDQFLWREIIISMLKNVLQTVPLVVAVKGATLLVMRRPPQKLLRMLIPAVFSAPGMFRQSHATVLEMTDAAAATLPQLQQPYNC